MQRRNAIKNIGVSFGFIAMTPSVMGMLQSCAKTNMSEYTPIFFNNEQMVFLDVLSDVILPKTQDAPSASEVNVSKFVDKYIPNVLNTEQADLYKTSFQAFSQVILAQSNKQELSDLEIKDIETCLDKYLKSSENTKQKYYEVIYKFREKPQFIENLENDVKEALCFSFLQDYRSKCIWAYKISEYVGEKVLAYKAIPGMEKGCITVEEATGGKAWAL